MQKNLVTRFLHRFAMKKLRKISMYLSRDIDNFSRKVERENHRDSLWGKFLPCKNISSTVCAVNRTVLLYFNGLNSF